MDPVVKTQPRRDGAIDALRALAILLVMLYHVPQLDAYLDPLTQLVRSHGILGVNLFFVLSGFLIGGIYFRELESGSFNLARFWMGRWLRTIPPYLAIVAVWWLGNRLSGSPKSLPWAYGLFLQNYLFSPPFPYLPFSWSLCVEEHFYVALPLLLLPFTHRPGRVFFVLCALAAVSVVGRFFADGKFFTTHLQLDGLAGGVFVAYLRQRLPTRFALVQRICRRATPVTLPLLICGLYFTSRATSTALADAIFVSWIIAAKDANIPFISSSRIVRAIAVRSYSCYLIHGYAFMLSQRLFGGLPPLALALAYVTSAASGTWIFYQLAEKPALALRASVMGRAIEPKETEARRPAA